MPATIIPDVVSEQETLSLQPSDSAHDAARLMAEHDVSAIVVSDHNGKLTGIATERDLTRRVVAQDLRGSRVTVGDVLTTMARLRVRHLPVVSDGKVLGMVSIRDLRQSVSRRVLAI